jgi:uncharacterized membrane protein YoaK (UPF0700 family)
VTYEKACQAGLPMALSALAGYVDAIGFLQLGGLFVSFMSGNSTQLGVGMAGTGPTDGALAGLLILLFLVGVILGALLVRAAHGWQQSAVLGFEAVVLLAAALVQGAGYPLVAVAAMTLAMGIENNVFLRAGFVSIGLTYMTGTLVRMGQAMAIALTGGPRFGWLADLVLWVGLICGGVLGAMGYRHAGLAALWPAVAYIAVLTLLAALRGRQAA